MDADEAVPCSPVVDDDLLDFALDVCRAAKIAVGGQPINREQIAGFLHRGFDALLENRELKRHTVACFEFSRLPDDGLQVEFKVTIMQFLQDGDPPSR